MARILVVTWAGGGNVPPAITLATQLAGTRPRRAGDRHRVAGRPLRGRRHPVRRPRRCSPSGTPPRWPRDVLAEARKVDLVVGRLHAAGRAERRPRRPACRSWRSCTRSTPPTSTTPAGCTRWGWRSPSTRSPRSGPSSACRRWRPSASCSTGAPALLVTCPESLDLPSPDRPGHVRYVGPLLEPPGADAGWRPPGVDDGRPLVVAGLGHHADGRAPGAPAGGHRARRGAGARAS